MRGDPQRGTRYHEEIHVIRGDKYRILVTFQGGSLTEPWLSIPHVVEFTYRSTRISYLPGGGKLQKELKR
jgi:hypothetical protein